MSLPLSQGENVARELQALVKDLPVVLGEVGKDAANLEEQILLYTAFTNFVCEWCVHNHISICSRYISIFFFICWDIRMEMFVLSAGEDLNT